MVHGQTTRMKVLSLFDGISVARYAIEQLGVKQLEYYASEIDVQCRTIARRNYPDTIGMGGVHIITKDRRPNLFDGSVDLLIGGSPCQDLSIAKQARQGLKGSRSNLFWEFARIKKEAKPKWFVLENVASMPEADKAIISKELGVEPIMIDAQLVSAQRRKRLFWTNIPGITQPEDRGIFLRDILQLASNQDTAPKAKTLRLGGRGSGHGDRHNWDEYQIVQYRRSYWRRTKGGKVPTLTANMGTGGNNVPYIEQVPRGKNKGGNVSKDGKSPTLTRSSFEHNNKLVFKDRVGKTKSKRIGGWVNDSEKVLAFNKDKKRSTIQEHVYHKPNSKTYAVTVGHTPKTATVDGLKVRALTPVECERLQSLPDGYTEGVSTSARYEAIGNAFNAEVIKHILSFIPKR